VNAVVFLGALALAVIALEVGTAIQNSIVWHNKLAGASVTAGVPAAPRRSTWEALLVAIFPTRFDPNHETSKSNVIDLLRRAGYPFDTPGEFYASAIKYFTIYLIAGAVTAGVAYIFGLGIAAPFLAGAFIYMGLVRPYANLRLAVLESLLTAGQDLQEAMRNASQVGGPFCNLMLFLVVRIEIDKSAEKAIEITRAHIPDPSDVDMQLFLRDISDFFLRARPIKTSIAALRESVHRNILEATEKRASIVLQRTSILGIFAVVGLILSIILPFMNM
jgi:hypothetical protein